MDRNRIHKLTAEAVELLKEMVAIPSPSFSENAVCTHICNWLADKGIAHKRVGNNIIAGSSWQNAPEEQLKDKCTEEHHHKPTLMLCAHIDTVSPSEDYSFDPYEPDYVKAAEVIGSENIVAGLGSNDDGASAVSMIATFRYYIESRKNLLLVLSCEEERSGLNGMTGLWPQIKDMWTLRL